jgi:hypothetical protein
MSGTRSASRVPQYGLLVALCFGFPGLRARADLLLYYNFDDASDPQTAFDQSDRRNHGVIGVAVYTEGGRGRSGAPADRALDFLGGFDGAYIDVPAAVDEAFGSIVENDSATIAMWTFGGEFQPQNHFVFWFAEAEADPRQLSAHLPWSDGVIYFDVNGCCDATQRISQAEPDDTKWRGQWNHYAFVKDREITRIYQNGELWLEGQGKAPLLPIHNVRFGNGGGAPGNLSYNGLLDDIGVWDEALDQDQILNLMENGPIRGPHAMLTAAPDRGPAPLAVSFDASGSTTPEGTIDSYTWDFGDGESAMGLKVDHTYAKRGNYRARLTVKDTRGAQGSASKWIAAEFACGNVAPYTSADVGAPTRAGCARYEGGDYVVLGTGRDIRQRADQFHFVYQEETGDVTLTVQLKEVILDSQFGGRAGLMLRDSTASDAAFAFIHASSSLAGLKATFFSRPTQGSLVTTRNSAVVLTPPDAWLRLERHGAEIIGYAATDGSTFMEVGRVTLTAPAGTMLGGMAATPVDLNDKGLTIEARMRPDRAGSEPIPFHRGDTDMNGQLEITDAIRLLGSLFLGGGDIPCADSGDVDDNGQLQLTDAIRILSALFLGRVEIALPGPPPAACGADPTPDDAGTDLGCRAYTGC